MESRKHLYVSRKHFTVCLVALCILASAVSRIVLFSGNHVWSSAVWPSIAAVLYVLIVLFSGEEQLHRTAVPVWIYGISCALQTGSVLEWLICLFFCACYTLIISGWTAKGWLLPLCLLTLGGAVYGGGNLPDLLMIAGMILLFPAVKVHTDGKWHPTWGDRIDGRRVRTAPAMEQITAYFMPNRNGANNMFSESVEITELERYVRRKRREGLSGFGISHVIMAAYVRTVAKYPALNRFIAGQRIYSRSEDIALCMTIKKEMTREAPDSLVKVHLHPGDTAADVYRKFTAKVEEAKDEIESTNQSIKDSIELYKRGKK